MKREIKFRVWNGEQMISPDYITRDGFGFWKEDSIPTMSKELMQFIGLLDSKGIEIYEGDILECGEDKPVLVKWNNFLSSFGISKEGWLYMHFFGEAVDPNNCTIIGNIYTHPQLLQQ